MLYSHAASSTDEDTQQSNILPSEEDLQPVKNKKKRQYENTKRILAQPTIFGLGNKYKITQSKIDKKTRKVLKKLSGLKTFVRVVMLAFLKCHANIVAMSS